MKLSRLSIKSSYILMFSLIIVAISPSIFLAHPVGALPAISTLPATNVQYTYATLNGGLYGGEPTSFPYDEAGPTTVNLQYDGEGPVNFQINGWVSITVNFQYGVAGSDWASCLETTTQPKNAGETFSQIVGNLSPNTTYQFRVKAEVGISIYGTTKTFTTPARSGGDGDWSYIRPGVTTIGADDVTGSSAAIIGNLTSIGSAGKVRVYFKYGTHYYQTIWPLWAGGNVTAYQVQTAPGEFSANIANLNPGTTYYFRAMGYGEGIGRGAVKTFTTP